MTPYFDADITSKGLTYGMGNIFSIGVGGTNYQNLVSFTGTSGSAIGAVPFGGLTLGGATLYGMTEYGGANGYGILFSVGTDGTSYQNLVSFTGSSGTAIGLGPIGSLTVDGTTLYGMTSQGGVNGYGNLFSVGTDGTNYRNLVSFTGSGGTASGYDPFGSLILGGTTLYGMTEQGFAGGWGNVFSVGINGSDYQYLHGFTGGADGGQPFGDLTLSAGTLFGMTSEGGTAPGSSGYGTVFAIALPTPVPESGTLALAGTAAVLLVSYRWRRRWPRWKNRR